ncbi:RAS2 protein [Oleoguttula sp. CCFEE 5521]
MSDLWSSGLLDTYQIVVAGGGGTGKTCLVKQLILSHFFDELDPTIEDSYRKQVVIDESVCLLEVLDTAGQEEYSAMRAQYVQKSEGIIIVYSITSRQSFEEARTFYHQIIRVREEVIQDDEVFPLCLVGNKADLHGQREVTIAEGIALAKELCCEHVETSAKSRTNVDECFEDLVREIRTQRALKATQDSTQSRSIPHRPVRSDWSLRRQTPQFSSRSESILQEDLALTSKLVHAARSNDEQATKKLLSEGADPDKQFGLNGSAIYAAAAAGHLNMVAAVEGHQQIVQLLLETGVPVDEMSRMYGTALLGAASRDRVEVVRVLLKHGADANATGGHEPYKRALHASAVIGSTTLARLLLSSGAEIDAQGPNGLTALGMACQHGKPEIVRLLLERGAQPNPQHQHYGFEVKIASERGHYKVVKLLLAWGASDALVTDSAQSRTRTTTNMPTDVESDGFEVADRSLPTVRASLPAALSSQGLRPPGSVTQAHSQIDTRDTHERRQSSPMASVFQRRTLSGQDAAPNVRSSSASRSWKFWKPTPQPSAADETPGSELREERCGLFELYNQSSSSRSVVDIVAIHGLGGHWKATWSGSSGNLWLRDFLPQELQKDGLHVRTLSYGYDSDWAFSKSVNDVDDEAANLLDRLSGVRQTLEEQARPIIFVAHSLGGIVAKKAMIIAHERSQLYGKMLSKVHSAVFFGVPHRGSDIAFWAYFAGKLLEPALLGFVTNTRHVSALRRNSKTFADISQQFIDRGAMLKVIRTYYESEKMGNQLVVDKDSAVLRLPNEIAVEIAASNHRTICKIDRLESQKYKQIGPSIQGLVKSALDSMS